jgi:hypothetical protein
MLNLIENLLLKAITPALPQPTKLLTGLIPTPADADAPMVNISVTSLKFMEHSDDSKRKTAHVLKRINLTGNGNLVEFSLPLEVKGDVIEVELSTGRLAKSGDDYWLEGGKLKFYSPPLTAFSVLIRCESARGYQESSSCLGVVNIDVWALQATAADSLLTSALVASLAAFVGLDRLELGRSNTTGFSLRLINPMLEPASLECSRPANSLLICNRVQLKLSAECELILALGTPATQGMIKQIGGRLDIIDSQSPTINFKIG